YGTPSPLKLHAGQQVSANARDGTVEVGPVAAAPAVLGSAVAEVHHDPAPPLSSDEPAPALAPALPSAGPSRRTSWSDAVGAGDYTMVLREAERRGMSSVLSEAPLAD